MKGTPDTARPSGRLFVVATPIGNLEDITLRALRVLREVALVAAEDTRRTGNLLRHYEIRTTLVSVHGHNERIRVPRIIDRLSQGDSVALASDAGTPGISDPGALLVHAVREAGFRVEAIPGPSAVTAALSVAGLSFDRFVFAGFPPVRSIPRTKWFNWVASLTDVPVVCFEAPHRLGRTLQDCDSRFGERPIIWHRELTKAYDEWGAGSADEILGRLRGARGEFVVIVCPLPGDFLKAETPTDARIMDLFGQITNKNTGSRRSAIRKVGESLGVSARAVYDALERQKKLVE